MQALVTIQMIFEAIFQFPDIHNLTVHLEAKHSNKNSIPNV